MVIVVDSSSNIVFWYKKHDLGCNHRAWYFFKKRLTTSFIYDQKQPLEMFDKESVTNNFAEFIGKNLCRSLFFNKFAGLRPATLLKKENPMQVFAFEFSEIFRSTYFV